MAPHPAARKSIASAKPWTARGQRGALLLLLAALGTLGLAACSPPSTPPPQTSGRAALIIGHGDGSFRSTCVTFEGSEISGEDLLRQSGMPVALDQGNALGTLVCSISGEGCAFPDEACLCRCRGAGPCSYWAYFNGQDGAWVYAVQGARLRQLRQGDLDAWIWVDRSQPSDELPLPPADLTFDAICG